MKDNKNMLIAIVVAVVVGVVVFFAMNSGSKKDDNDSNNDSVEAQESTEGGTEVFGTDEVISTPVADYKIVSIEDLGAEVEKDPDFADIEGECTSKNGRFVSVTFEVTNTTEQEIDASELIYANLVDNATNEIQDVVFLDFTCLDPGASNLDLPDMIGSGETVEVVKLLDIPADTTDYNLDVTPSSISLDELLTEDAEDLAEDFANDVYYQFDLSEDL